MDDELFKLHIKKWTNGKFGLQGNFTKSNKVLELKHFLLQKTSFLDILGDVPWSIRYYYYINNIDKPFTCNTCGKVIPLRKDYFKKNKYCSHSCGFVNEQRNQKISEKKLKRQKESPYAEMTLQWWQWKYGEKDGLRRYEERGRKVAQTREAMLTRYGPVLGAIRYDAYIKKISESQQLDTLINKYGEEEGRRRRKDILSKKKMCLSNFVRCYGEEEGELKYNEWLNKINLQKSYSKISQELFEDIYFNFKHDKIYFATLNKEFNRFNGVDRCYFFDFVDTKNKKVIEFNGDMWHANPEKFSPEDVVNPFTQQKAGDIWDYDQQKINFISNLGYSVLVVWESDYRENKDAVLELCLEFLRRG